MATAIDREPLLLINDDPEMGGKDVDDITSDFAYRNNVANAGIGIRLGFIRKVYCLLAFQLALTIILGSVALFVPPVKFFIIHNDWMLMLGMIATFAILIALFAFRKTHPHNLILLTAFTVAESYLIGAIISFYDSLVVLQAFALTFVVVLGLTLYTFQTSRDFTSMGAGLSAGLFVLLFGSFLQLLIGGTGLDFLISCGGALLFSLFIIYDTQMIMQKLSPEEYILATINLYLDIINLFLYILRILAETRRQ